MPTPKRLLLPPILPLAACLPLLLSACADDGQSEGGDEVGETIGSETDDGETTTADETGTDVGETTEGETGPLPDMGTDPDPPALPLCGTEPPAGAELAPALPSYGGPGGSCPILETGMTVNVMDTSAGEREFYVIVPSDLAPDEDLPIIFMYHWLGGDALDFIDRAEAQVAADYYRFIAIVPEGRESGDGVPFRWPFSVVDSQQLVDEEFEFHDDMLACVAEQFGADKECVSSMGVSAGALWSGVLAHSHGEHLANFISLSGGSGADLIKPWGGAEHRMPALVLWGGRDDFCVAINFEQTSQEMEAALEADNHFVLECIHNCTHATPPFDPADPEVPTYAPMWEFFLDHPYWLEDGDSPYLDYELATGELPPNVPEWCAIGAGNASIRVGECGGSEC